MIGYSKGGTGYCLIKVDNLFEDQTESKGIDNLPLMVDTTFQPERRIRTTGEVIQLPLFMGNQPIMSIGASWPGYGPIRYLPDQDSDDEISTSLYSQGYYDYKVMSDIELDVKIGDVLLMKWRVIFGHKNLVAETKDKKGDRMWIYKCPMDHAYCAIRNGEIIMLGSYVFVDGVFEEWDDILVPTYSHIKDEHGKPILKPKSQWIQKKTAPGQLNRQGIVKHIGLPLKGEKRYLEVGDKILYKPNLKSLITVQGKRYFALLQDQIIARVL